MSETVTAVEAGRDTMRFDRAKKVAEADYPANLPVTCPAGYGYGEWDGWFQDVATLREFCEDNERSLPAWVYGGFWRRFTLNAEQIVQDECESGEHHDDAFGFIGADEIARLQSMLDGWCATLSSGTATGETDHATVVILALATGSEA